MGNMCGGGDDEKDSKFEAGGKNDLSNGPAQNRGCTDIMCIPLFLAAQVVFIFVTVAGMADGNPDKLYKPRDYQGAYCGVETNWNNGPKLAGQPKLTYTMNVTSFVETTMKQTICSTQAATVMESLLADQAAIDKYNCDCCRSPCDQCEGAFDVGDLSSAAALTEVVTAKMAELTNPDKAKELFNPAGANADSFSTDKFWSEATKYFNQVCLPKCMETATDRTYKYQPPRDSVFYPYWSLMLNTNSTSPATVALKSVVDSAFSFGALPESVCPYHVSLCVPIPGMTLKEVSAGSDYCTFEMAAEVINALGEVASAALTSIGIESFKGAATDSMGKWIGDFQASIDTFIVTSILSFVIGVQFLVMLRFFVGCCVWFAVVLTVLAFAFFGYFLFVISYQCSGASLFDTGHQTAVAVIIATKTLAIDTINGVETVSEALTGNGADYRGRQHYTRYGKKCVEWENQTRFTKYRAANYTALDPYNNTKNFCRNPYTAGDTHVAKTIWCITSDPDVAWEECLPIGVIQPECSAGYAIEGKSMREALWYSSFVVWVLGGIWLIAILCSINRIRLAIALNKVAATYLSMNPSTVLIPVVQAIIGITWCAAWFYAASFLLSQVPDTYISKDYYATYTEAYGTESPCSIYEFGDHCTAIPGKCNDKWPTGGVWKDTDCQIVDGVAKCWRCSPPRYVFDYRFAVSFFVFLWNNAFNIACGQIIIAMAVSTWFFAEEKMTKFVVFPGVRTVFRYHLGTVAFGSFIVALVEFIRYLMKYFEKQAEAQKNRVMVLLLKVLQCCIWCFEKCIKFLNKNAYIQTALMGTNFCVSAKKAFFLILRNVLRFGTVAVLGNVIRAIGFVCIVSGTGAVGYLLMREMNPDISPFLPLVMMLMVAYVVAQLFMNVFGLAVDTSLQCFLAVEEMGTSKDNIPDDMKRFFDNNPPPKQDDQTGA